MKKLLLAITAAVALAGCGGSSTGVTSQGDLRCYQGYSYLEINGQIVPSPSTLAGDWDFECPQI